MLIQVNNLAQPIPFMMVATTVNLTSGVLATVGVNGNAGTINVNLVQPNGTAGAGTGSVYDTTTGGVYFYYPAAGETSQTGMLALSAQDTSGNSYLYAPVVADIVGYNPAWTDQIRAMAAKFNTNNPNIWTDSANDLDWNNNGNWTRGVPAQGDVVFVPTNLNSALPPVVNAPITSPSTELTLQGFATFSIDGNPTDGDPIDPSSNIITGQLTIAANGKCVMAVTGDHWYGADGGATFEFSNGSIQASTINSASFTGNSQLVGTLNMAWMDDYSSIAGTGLVNNIAYMKGFTTSSGTVAGLFGNERALPNGTVTAAVIMDGNSNFSGTLMGNAILHGLSALQNCTVTGSVTSYDAANNYLVTINGNAAAYDSASYQNTAISGNCFLHDASSNDYGTEVAGTLLLEISASNAGAAGETLYEVQNTSQYPLVVNSDGSVNATGGDSNVNVLTILGQTPTMVGNELVVAPDAANVQNGPQAVNAIQWAGQSVGVDSNNNPLVAVLTSPAPNLIINSDGSVNATGGGDSNVNVLTILGQTPTMVGNELVVAPDAANVQNGPQAVNTIQWVGQNVQVDSNNNPLVAVLTSPAPNLIINSDGSVNATGGGGGGSGGSTFWVDSNTGESHGWVANTTMNSGNTVFPVTYGANGGPLAGPFQVNSNSAGTDSLQWVFAGTGVPNGIVTAYAQSDYNTGFLPTTVIKGQTTTDVNGRWGTPGAGAPISLTAGVFVLTCQSTIFNPLPTVTINISNSGVVTILNVGPA